MSRPRITIKIDRIVTDQPGLDRAKLSRALEREIAREFAQTGAEAFGPGRHLARQNAQVTPGKAALPTRVAQATLKAVRS